MERERKEEDKQMKLTNVNKQIDFFFHVFAHATGMFLQRAPDGMAEPAVAQASIL